MEEDRKGDFEHAEPSRTLVEEKTIHAHNAALAAALEEERPSLWGKGYIRLYMICGLLYLCSTMTGEYASLWSLEYMITV
jgi:hypothetical protein